ncbi:MAG: tyrosine-type recombinase/integrase [Butyrivibrio sp.]|nr:tyrosine-type recombinase/integrase [Butyrivibrio sp.]
MMDEISAFITELKLEGRLSENTVRSYELDLSKLSEYALENGIVKGIDLSADFLKKYLEKIEADDLSPSTIARNIVSIKAFSRYLLKKEIHPFDISEDLKAPKTSQSPVVILTRTQIKALLDAPDKSYAKGQRDEAILHLLYATGIKVSELIKLKVEDVDMQIGSIEISAPKMDRVVPFNKETREVLSRYLQEGRRHLITTTSEELLFVNYKGMPMSRQGIWKIIREYSRAAGIDQSVTPEMIRHSFAAHMIERGADMDAVQFMMGHVSSAAMTRYARDNKDYIRDVYNSTH